MGKQRVAAAQNLVKRELLQWMVRHFEAPDGSVVTVEEVVMTPDLLTARVAISVYPVAQRARVMKELRSRRRDARAAIAKRITWRAVPELMFLSDDREERADRIYQLLEKK